MSDLVENIPASKTPEISAPKTVSRPACRQCFETLDLGDNFCRHCGTLTDVGVGLVKVGRLPAPTSTAIPERPLGWTENAVIVLLALSLIGPLAIPMLWRSRRFTRGWKIGLTVAVLAVTVFACWYTVKAINAALDQAWQQSGLL